MEGSISLLKYATCTVFILFSWQGRWMMTLADNIFDPILRSVKTVSIPSYSASEEDLNDIPRRRGIRTRRSLNDIYKKKVKTEDTFILEHLEITNKYRALHGVPPLELDYKLCMKAEEWAQELADRSEKEGNPVIIHSWTFETGENIYAEKKTGDGILSGGKVASKWYSQCKDHTWKPNFFSSNSARFSQVVWKDTKRMGIGKVTSAPNNLTIVVAWYLPCGNWGYYKSFKENVFPSVFDKDNKCYTPSGSENISSLQIPLPTRGSKIPVTSTNVLSSNPGNNSGNGNESPLAKGRSLSGVHKNTITVTTSPHNKEIKTNTNGDRGKMENKNELQKPKKLESKISSKYNQEQSPEQKGEPTKISKVSKIGLEEEIGSVPDWTLNSIELGVIHVQTSKNNSDHKIQNPREKKAKHLNNNEIFGLSAKTDSSKYSPVSQEKVAEGRKVVAINSPTHKEKHNTDKKGELPKSSNVSKKGHMEGKNGNGSLNAVEHQKVEMPSINTTKINSTHKIQHYEKAEVTHPIDLNINEVGKGLSRKAELSKMTQEKGAMGRRVVAINSSHAIEKLNPEKKDVAPKMSPGFKPGKVEGGKGSAHNGSLNTVEIHKVGVHQVSTPKNNSNNIIPNPGKKAEATKPKDQNIKEIKGQGQSTKTESSKLLPVTQEKVAMGRKLVALNSSNNIEKLHPEKKEVVPKEPHYSKIGTVQGENRNAPNGSLQTVEIQKEGVQVNTPKNNSNNKIPNPGKKVDGAKSKNQSGVALSSPKSSPITQEKVAVGTGSNVVQIKSPNTTEKPNPDKKGDTIKMANGSKKENVKGKNGNAPNVALNTLEIQKGRVLLMDTNKNNSIHKISSEKQVEGTKPKDVNTTEVKGPHNKTVSLKPFPANTDVTQEKLAMGIRIVPVNSSNTTGKSNTEIRVDGINISHYSKNGQVEVKQGNTSILVSHQDVGVHHVPTSKNESIHKVPNSEKNVDVTKSKDSPAVTESSKISSKTPQTVAVGRMVVAINSSNASEKLNAGRKVEASNNHSKTNQSKESGGKVGKHANSTNIPENKSFLEPVVDLAPSKHSPQKSGLNITLPKKSLTTSEIVKPEKNEKLKTSVTNPENKVPDKKVEVANNLEKTPVKKTEVPKTGSRHLVNKTTEKKNGAPKKIDSNHSNKSPIELISDNKNRGQKREVPNYSFDSDIHEPKNNTDVSNNPVHTQETHELGKRGVTSLHNAQVPQTEDTASPTWEVAEISSNEHEAENTQGASNISSQKINHPEDAQRLDLTTLSNLNTTQVKRKHNHNHTHKKGKRKKTLILTTIIPIEESRTQPQLLR